MKTINYFIVGLANIMAERKQDVIVAMAPIATEKFNTTGRVSYDLWLRAGNIIYALQNENIPRLLEVLEDLSTRGMSPMWELQYWLWKGAGIDTSVAGLEKAMWPVSGRKAHIRENIFPGSKYTYDVIVEDGNTVVVKCGGMKGYEAKRLVLEVLYSLDQNSLDYIWRNLPAWGKMLDLMEARGAETSTRAVKGARGLRMHIEA